VYRFTRLRKTLFTNLQDLETTLFIDKQDLETLFTDLHDLETTLFTELQVYEILFTDLYLYPLLTNHIALEWQMYVCIILLISCSWGAIVKLMLYILEIKFTTFGCAQGIVRTDILSYLNLIKFSSADFLSARSVFLKFDETVV